MKNRFVLYLFAMSVILAVGACKNNSQNKDITTPADTVASVKKDTVDKFMQFKYDMVISNIPFPFEMLDKLYASGISFHENSMNPVENVAMYSLSNSKALNLGIYGADLAYAVTFEEFHQIGPYIKNTKRLAEDLNIPMAFNQEMLDRYNKFKDNKDSLSKVVYDSYNKVDKTLKSNERIGTAGLVVVGSWLEGLYLSTRSVVEENKPAETKSVNAVIWKQKLHLDRIIKLLDEFKKEEYFAKMLTELKDIKSVYEHLAVGTEINDKEIGILNQKVEKLRNRIIQGL